MSRLKIAILHHELTMGGAERAVIEIAKSLQAAGHQVTIFTARLERLRSFEGAMDGTLDIRPSAMFLPPHIAQCFRAPCTILRMAYLAAIAAIRSGRFDVIICDQVAHVIPLLKRLSLAKVVFYCHFPDQLLTQWKTPIYQLYRWPIDRLETSGMYLADAVIVNSRFTACAVEDTFPRLHPESIHVVYPGVDVQRYEPAAIFSPADNREIVLLSLNRYKYEKNHGLAIRALSVLRRRLPGKVFVSLRLVIAGDFDSSHHNDLQTLLQLQHLTHDLNLTAQVTFQRSCSEADRLDLLRRCRCVIYTPINEHFGLGPVEAMAAGVPVVAAASGGPLETIRDQETGFLCEPTEDAFAAALERLILNRTEAERMGLAGRRRVEQHFSLSIFAEGLSAVLENL